jgi:hypothetical protein
MTRKPGLKNRQLAAQIRREAYDVPAEVRDARRAARDQFDLVRLKVAADERLEAARNKLELVDLFGLRRELEDAIAAQVEIEGKLSDLQGEKVQAG